MKTMAIGTFKATCLKVLDNIHTLKEPLVITKRGKPIVKIHPINSGATNTLYGSVVFEDNIISRSINKNEWDILK